MVLLKTVIELLMILRCTSLTPAESAIVAAVVTIHKMEEVFRWTHLIAVTCQCLLRVAKMAPTVNNHLVVKACFAAKKMKA